MSAAAAVAAAAAPSVVTTAPVAPPPARLRITTRHPWHNPALDVWVGVHDLTAATAHRSPYDSIVSVELPFRSNPELLEQYVNFAGKLRLGKLLQDLDSLAGSIAYVHAGFSDPTSCPVTIVTASCDRIDLMRPLSRDVDMIMTGCCTYTGNSSMNVDLELSDVPPPGVAPVPYITASFTMVARDAQTGKATPVMPCAPVDAATQRWYEDGKRLQTQRKAARAMSLDRVPPTYEELAIVHRLFMESRSTIVGTAAKIPPNMVLAKDTIYNSLRVCHPQNRNVHNKVFGGFLMREAYELAWMSARIFSEQMPRFVALDDLAFVRPVEIGSLLVFTSIVDFTTTAADGQGILSISVSTQTVDPDSKRTNVANDFHFTFEVDKPTKQVMPDSYASAMRFVEAHRRYRSGTVLREELQARATAGTLLRHVAAAMRPADGDRQVPPIPFEDQEAK